MPVGKIDAKNRREEAGLCWRGNFCFYKKMQAIVFMLKCNYENEVMIQNTVDLSDIDQVSFVKLHYLSTVT